MSNRIERICANCGKTFTTTQGARICCSLECGEARNRELAKLRYERKPKKEPKKYFKNCSICGNAFETTQPRACLCSSECKREYQRIKQKEYAKRRKAERVREVREVREDRRNKPKAPKVSNANLIAEDNRKAKELGMSYGMYKAMKLMEGECYE